MRRTNGMMHRLIVGIGVLCAAAASGAAQVSSDASDLNKADLSAPLGDLRSAAAQMPTPSAAAAPASAPACPDVSGVYFLDAGAVTKHWSVDPAAVAPGSCRYEGEGETTELLRGEVHFEDMNADYPSGLRIYVYAASPDRCKYRSFFSFPRGQGDRPYLDTISYDEFRARMPSADDIAWGRVPPGILIGALDLTGFQRNPADGSLTKVYPGYTNQPSSDNGTLGIHVVSSWHSSFTIRPNGDIAASAFSQTKGVSFEIIPVFSTDAATCVFRKIQ